MMLARTMELSALVAKIAACPEILTAFNISYIFWSDATLESSACKFRSTKHPPVWISCWYTTMVFSPLYLAHGKHMRFVFRKVLQNKSSQSFRYDQCLSWQMDALGTFRWVQPVIDPQAQTIRGKEEDLLHLRYTLNFFMYLVFGR